jgi:hypothetical protein
VSETQSIEPIFFDFPFLHQTVIPDAWKTVWYFDVAVAPDIAPTGRVYTVGFAVTANNLPSTFRVPDARIGVEGPGGHVSTVYGQAVNLELDDMLPPYMTLLDARLANAAEEAQLEAYLAAGQIITAQNVFNNLRDNIGILTQTVSGGTHVELGLPVTGTTDATQWPWLDAGTRSGTMYVVLKSKAAINWSGTAVANYGPVITYTDPFLQVYTSTGNLQTVEVHGANVVVTYTVRGITTTADGVAHGGIVPGIENAVAVDVVASNLGDYIASATRITVVVPSGVVISQAVPAPVVVGTGYAVFDLGDLAPGSAQVVSVIFDVTPPAGSQQVRLVTHTDGRFINQFITASGQVRNVPVAGQLAGPLDVRATGWHIYLPIITRQWSHWPTAVR